MNLALDNAVHASADICDADAHTCDVDAHTRDVDAHTRDADEAHVMSNCLPMPVYTQCNAGGMHIAIPAHAFPTPALLTRWGPYAETRTLTPLLGYAHGVHTPVL